jgi:hypothetical protein
MRARQVAHCAAFAVHAWVGYDGEQGFGETVRKPHTNLVEHRVECVALQDEAQG